MFTIITMIRVSFFYDSFIIPAHIHPYEIVGVFHKSHVQKEFASFKFPDNHEKISLSLFQRHDGIFPY